MYINTELVFASRQARLSTGDVIVVDSLDLGKLPDLGEDLVLTDKAGATAKVAVFSHSGPVEVGRALTHLQHFLVGRLKQTVGNVVSEICKTNERL